MSQTIFLLSGCRENEELLKDTISEEYDIHTVSMSNLMVELYKKNPVLLIVDLEGIGQQAIEMIQPVLNIEYIPVIYVIKNENLNYLLPSDTVLITINELGNAIGPLFTQAASFKSKYDKVKDSYSAIDLLNGAVKSVLKKYMSLRKNDSKFIIKELLDTIYARNFFLENKPGVVWNFTSVQDRYEASLFILSGDNYSESASFYFNKQDSFKFDVYAGSGVSKNYNVNELSDIGSSLKIFPGAIKDYTPEINNFAGYAVGDYIIIGMNYTNNVTNYEIDIIKALTINFDLISTIKYQMNELESAFDYTIDALARAAEANDDVTGHHIKRVNTFSKCLAEEMKLDNEFVSQIQNAAQMHDVGKIYVDKAILTKPGRLTDEEFELIKKHTIYGERIIGGSEYLKMSAEVSRSHHEKFDGTGYPDGKKGTEIPLSARIVFLADIYDALRSERPYKRGFTHEETFEIITKGDGRVNPEHFDPEVLQAFVRIHSDFQRIYDELKD